MSNFANAQTQQLKHQLTVAALIGTIIVGTTLSIVHNLTPDAHPVDRTVPAIIAIIDLFLLIDLKRNSAHLFKVMYVSAIATVICLILPSWGFTIQAITHSNLTLIDTLPPMTAGVLLLPMVMVITLAPHHLFRTILILWGLISTPILLYLLLHPNEITSPRGLDLTLALGPGMGLQVALMLFYNHLQTIVDRLYNDRLQYYSQIIERQSIRQQAIEQAFTQIHNGPLQTLTVLLRDVEIQPLPATELYQRLDDLNAEIRAVRSSLTDEIDRKTTSKQPLEITTPEDHLRLGEGSEVDLNQPLHRLFQEVYRLTLQRNLPHFNHLKVKIRDFTPCRTSDISFSIKRDLCLWLEEALCNIGKHASGATRIVVTGKQQANHYVLNVQDNGRGRLDHPTKQGTQHSEQLAQQLHGKFSRSVLPQGGINCELSWETAPDQTAQSTH